MKDAAGGKTPKIPEGAEGAEGADAQLRFGGTPDRMKVGIARYTPATGAGRPLSLELLRQALHDAGVNAALDEDNASDAVRLLLAGQDARQLVIARGTRPQEPQDARFEPLAAPNLPVFPGQALGRLFPAVQPREGRDVAGSPVPPKEARPAREIALGSGIARDPDGLLTAQTAGVLRIEAREGGQLVRLEPLARISGDRLQATCDLHAKDALGGDIAPEAVVLALSGQGISFGMDLDAIVRGLAEARASGRGVPDVVVARGQAPAHGVHGRLELLCDGAAETEPADEHARIDYRDRGAFPVARKGQDIALLHPPTKGAPGRDVLNRAMTARDGQPLRLALGKGVEALPADEHGVTLHRARVDGVVLAGKASLDVSADTALKVDGKQSIKLDYDISQGGYLWAARGYNLDVKGAGCWSIPAQKINWKRFNAFSVYMYGTNSGGKVAFDIKDKGAEMWRFVLEDNFTGWKEIVIPYSEFFARSDWQPYNADKNGKIDFPVMSFQFEPRRPDKSVYHFDRVRLVRTK